MKNKVTLDDLKKVKPDFETYFSNVALESLNAAFEAVSKLFEVSKEDFLKVVASDYSVVYFIGRAYLAAREDEKGNLATHSFYLFNILQDKQTELA